VDLQPDSETNARTAGGAAGGTSGGLGCAFPRGMALAEDLGGDSDFLFRRQLAVWRALWRDPQRCAERLWDRVLLDHGGNDPVGLFDDKKCVRW